MKRTRMLSVIIACGLLTTGLPVFAQSAAEVTASSRDWFGGTATVQMLGRDDIDSSKYDEYREVVKGMSMPVFTLQGSQNGKDFGLFGQNISRTDQRYTGYANVGALGVSIDYKQIPHSMGNDALVIWNNTAPGVWGMSSTLRAALNTAIDTQLPTSARTHDFYADLYAPAIAAANLVDLDSLRQRGDIEISLGRNLPFDLKMTYMRQTKSGTRGATGGRIANGFGNLVVTVPAPLNEVTQDGGFKFALSRTWGNVHAAFNHNWYNNRQETLLIDNPYRPFDLLYTSASGSVPAMGGPGTVRIVGPPDNAANTGSVGALFKFAKQTRITVDVTTGRWTQNAQLYPYTTNSTILTPDGVRADSLAALQVQSANGKIDTQTVNLGFSSRPAEGLGLRMHYRNYEMDNQTPTFVRNGSTGNNVDRNWSNAPAPSADAPFGWVTANPYGSKTARFDVQASYHIQALTVEGAYRGSKLERTYREATKGAESGMSIAAIIHSSEKLVFRGVFDRSKRTASGYNAATSIGLQADESERDSTCADLHLELTPNDKVGFVLAYQRRNDDYPNRPNRVAGVNSTSNGLLNAKYETYTAEVDLMPSERADFVGYYAYENNLSTTRYGGTGSASQAPYTPASSMLTFDGSDKTNTFGVNANFVLVPELYASGAGKWTLNVNASRQKLDGLVAITADPAGSFALQRAAYGGVRNIEDYDDTEFMTVSAELDTVIAESWDLAIGYAYEKYDFADAYTDGTDVFPTNDGFFLKANDKPYTAGAAYVKLNYRF